jgi:hypothetical protein
MVTSRWGHYDDVTRCLNPLLGQGDEWRVRWDHSLYRLQNCLEPNGVEVRI